MKAKSYSACSFFKKVLKKLSYELQISEMIADAAEGRISYHPRKSKANNLIVLAEF